MCVCFHRGRQAKTCQGVSERFDFNWSAGLIFGVWNQDRNGWKNLDLDEQEVFVSRGFKPPEVADRSDQTGGVRV